MTVHGFAADLTFLDAARQLLYMLCLLLSRITNFRATAITLAWAIHSANLHVQLSICISCGYRAHNHLGTWYMLTTLVLEQDSMCID